MDKSSKNISCIYTIGYRVVSTDTHTHVLTRTHTHTQYIAYTTRDTISRIEETVFNVFFGSQNRKTAYGIQQITHLTLQIDIGYIHLHSLFSLICTNLVAGA